MKSLFKHLAEVAQSSKKKVLSTDKIATPCNGRFQEVQKLYGYGCKKESPTRYFPKLSGKQLVFSSLLVPFFLFSPLLTPNARAVSIELDGTRSVTSGSDCGIATYRYGTNTTFEGKQLDLIVEVLDEDNEYPNTCVDVSSNKLSVRIRDKDQGDNVAYMDLKVTVVERNTTTPVEVDRLTMTGFDLDINSGGGTGSDDIYLKVPDGVAISTDSEVQYSEGSFFGGQYQAKLKGTILRNCEDTSGSAQASCRGAGIYINGINGVNKVSSITFRLQNDNAYGQSNSFSSNRRFEISFEVDDLDSIVTDNTDYGDAPSSYGNPGHSVSANIALGYGLVPDNESSTQASANADGDDTDTNTVDYDDDEAVQLNGQPLENQSLDAGATTNLDVTTYGTGYLSAWVDLDGNGNFSGADEQVVDDILISSNTVKNTSVPIAIPASATGGDSYIRFRFSTTQGVSFSGFSNSDGEVEDYQVAIASSTTEDYGDAPNDLSSIDGDLTSAYPTLEADNGAKHTIDGSTFLGSGVDSESDGQPTLNADSDSDDGVTFPTIGSNSALVVGRDNTIAVEASKAGVLNAWVDWNQDGDWEDAGEQIATNQALSAGSNIINVNPGTTTPHGSTYVRFRFSSQSGLQPTGAASDGEVEDYRVNVVIPEITACLAPLLNGGFESPAVNGSTPTPIQVFQSNRIVAYRESEVDGWAYISSNPNSSFSGSSVSGFEQRNAIELWRRGNSLNVPPHEGEQFAEINAYILGNLHQDVISGPGVTMRWQFAHRGRTGNDTIRIKIGPPGATVNQGEFTTGNTEWKVYSGTYTVPPGQTITRFEFEAVRTANGNSSTGNFVDDIRFGVDCNNSISGTVFQDYGTTVSSNTANDVLDTDESGIQNVNLNLYKDGGDGVFGDGSGNPGGDDTVVGSPVDTDSDGKYSFTGLIPGNYWVDVDADDEDLNGRTYGGGDVDTTQTDPRLITIVPGNDQIVNFPFDATNNPNVLLIKRITKINDGITTNGGDNLSIYNQEDSNPYDDNKVEITDLPENEGDPKPDTDKWKDTTSDTSSTFLIGGINGGKVEPDDELEYTIYYLSAGDSEAENVLVCDRVPGNVSFIPTSFNNQTAATGGLQGSDKGIQWLKDGNTESLTNVKDGDAAQYFPPGVEPSTVYPKIKCDGANTNGAIVVDLGNLPNATDPGTPNTSYGYIRFRGRVK